MLMLLVRFFNLLSTHLRQPPLKEALIICISGSRFSARMASQTPKRPEVVPSTSEPHFYTLESEHGSVFV